MFKTCICQGKGVGGGKYWEFGISRCKLRASLIVQLIKNLPAIQETLVRFLGWEDGEVLGYPLQYSWSSLVAQLVKNPPAMLETWVRSLGWEDPLDLNGRESVIMMLMVGKVSS